MVKWIVLAVIILGGLFLVAAFIWDGTREERMAICLDHLEGMEGFPYKAFFGISIKTDKKCVEFECKEKQILLPLPQIYEVNIITWEKFFTRALDPVVEGLVGGAIGGDTMAVISAIDAKGRTRLEKQRVENALEIKYYPKENGQIAKRLIFGKKFWRTETIQFAKTLCRYANLPGPNFIEPESKPQGPTYL